MTIEEKAKAYDEALEKAKDFYKGYKQRDNQLYADDLESIFPELKESEDMIMVKFIKNQLFNIKKTITENYELDAKLTKAIDWLEKQGNLMKALQISNAKIGELIEENYYLKEQLEKQRKNNMGISEATKQKLDDNLNKALEKETPESWNKFLDEQGEQKMKTPEESLGIDSDTYNKIVDECIYGEQKTIKKHNACEFCEDRYGCVNPCSMKLIEAKNPADNVEPRQEELTEFEKAVKQVMEEAIECGDIHNLKADADLLLRIARKTSWSEEDEEQLDRALYMMEQLDMTKSWDDVYNWLKSFKERVKPQKQEWSEEDIELIDNTIKFIEDRVAATSPSLRTYSPTLTGKEIPFLKSIKDRVQPKQEWSEEDNRMCKAIIDNIQAICEEGYFVGNIDSGELIEWLKSLRPQSQWKPSDEQMDALRYVTNFDYGGYKATLVSLYEQLKKLRGE